VTEPRSTLPKDSRSAEKAVLGSLIMANQCIPDAISSGLEQSSFSDPALGMVYKRIVGLHTLGKTADLVTLCANLPAGISLEEAADLVEQTPNYSKEAILSYSDIIIEAAKERRVYWAAQAYLNSTPEERSNGVGLALQAAIDGQSAAQSNSGPKAFSDILEDARAMKVRERLKLGLPGVDAAIGGGVLPGWMVVVGGFAGGAKTSNCAYMAIQMSRVGHPVMIVTTELGEIEFCGRIEGGLTEADTKPDIHIWSPEVDIRAVIARLGVWVDGLPEGSMPPVLIIDYVQRLRAPADEKVRERQVGVVCEALQTFGRRKQVIVVAAAQLNRQSQMEESPKLHHLRESGWIEQVADVALLVSKTGDSSLRLTVAKNRWGTSGKTIDLTADYARLEFREANPLDVFGAFGAAIEEKLFEGGNKPIKTRDIISNIRFGAGKAKKEDIRAAAEVSKKFVVVGSEVHPIGYKPTQESGFSGAKEVEV
jgi:replicative DNA helicase